MYVADTENHCIRRVDFRQSSTSDSPSSAVGDPFPDEADGGALVSTVAGACGKAGSDDGDGNGGAGIVGKARFSSPSGIGE